MVEKIKGNSQILFVVISALINNGRWLAVGGALLDGKKWQLNPDPWKLDNDYKLWFFDNKSLCDLKWDPLEVQTGNEQIGRFF